MNHAKMAWHMNPVSLAFYLPVIVHMPPDMMDCILDGSHHALVDSLLAQGYTVRLWDSVDWQDYEFIICDEWDLLYGDRFKENTFEGIRFCCLRHAVDQSGAYIPNAHYSIRAHKTLAEPRSAGKCVITRENAELFTKALALPAAYKTEYAYTGPYHMGEWLEKRHAPHQERRQELEEALQRTLPADKPVLAFFLDEYGEDRALVHGLKKLASHATIIYKGIEKKDSRLQALDKAVIPWLSVDYAPNVLRFGADAILAGYYAGTFVSSIMVGLRVLPFFTKTILFKGRSSHETDSFTRFLPKEGNSQSINQNCMLGMGRIFDIEETELLVQTLNDEVFWAEYANRLPEIQSMAFGDYTLDNTCQKTAALIVRAFIKGSFGKDAHLIHIRE